MDDITARLSAVGILPVIRLDRAEDAVPLARALVEGDLPVAEVTFRTDAAAEAIGNIAREFPEMLLGAGTVLNVAQAKLAVEAGARFIVSPGFSPAVVEWCAGRGVPVFPGVATPTEVMAALDAGLSVLKFFPAEEIGGVKMLKALAAPFSAVKFIPTGGITASNLPNYLQQPNVLAVGGSWMVKSDLIAGGNFAEVTSLALEARNLVKQIR